VALYVFSEGGGDCIFLSFVAAGATGFFDQVVVGSEFGSRFVDGYIVDCITRCGVKPSLGYLIASHRSAKNGGRMGHPLYM